MVRKVSALTLRAVLIVVFLTTGATVLNVIKPLATLAGKVLPLQLITTEKLKTERNAEPPTFVAIVERANLLSLKLKALLLGESNVCNNVVFLKCLWNKIASQKEILPAHVKGIF